jgi:hypothetical protein
VCDCSDQAAHYHNLGPKLGASLLTRHIGWKQKKEKEEEEEVCMTKMVIESFFYKQHIFFFPPNIIILLRHLYVSLLLKSVFSSSKLFPRYIE